MKCYEVLNKYVATGPKNIYLLDINARTFLKVPKKDKEDACKLIKRDGTIMTEDLFRSLIPTHSIELCSMKIEYLKELTT